MLILIFYFVPIKPSELSRLVLVTSDWLTKCFVKILSDPKTGFCQRNISNNLGVQHVAHSSFRAHGHWGICWGNSCAGAITITPTMEIILNCKKPSCLSPASPHLAIHSINRDLICIYSTKYWAWGYDSVLGESCKFGKKAHVGAGSFFKEAVPT